MQAWCPTIQQPSSDERFHQVLSDTEVGAWSKRRRPFLYTQARARYARCRIEGYRLRRDTLFLQAGQWAYPLLHTEVKRILPARRCRPAQTQLSRRSYSAIGRSSLPSPNARRERPAAPIPRDQSAPHVCSPPEVTSPNEPTASVPPSSASSAPTERSRRTERATPPTMPDAQQACTAPPNPSTSGCLQPRSQRPAISKPHRSRSRQPRRCHPCRPRLRLDRLLLIRQRHLRGLDRSTAVNVAILQDWIQCFGLQALQTGH